MPQEIEKCRQSYAPDDGEDGRACLEQRAPYYQARASEIFPFHFQITIAMHISITRASK